MHIGPSDYVPWLDDRKWAYVRLEGRNFGDVPLNLEYKLEVWDSPNSAGVIIDAIRGAKIAMDRGIGGPILSASSYFMKSPPEQYADDEARDCREVHPRRGRALSDVSDAHVTSDSVTGDADRLTARARVTGPASLRESRAHCFGGIRQRSVSASTLVLTEDHSRRTRGNPPRTRAS